MELEALPARHGDCMLLHFGSKKDPKLALIDGGPAGVYHEVLLPRLDEIREERGIPAGEPLKGSKWKDAEHSLASLVETLHDTATIIAGGKDRIA